uniref:Uncharacterized protein n=1 Tax=Gossypium raimondii TaxID=29730 RepID=A0A0D2SB94_GOSRA|nr:hypothetical protein B456_007G108100 [Gossypium raimondii]
MNNPNSFHFQNGSSIICLITKSSRMGKYRSDFLIIHRNKRLPTNGPQILQITIRSHTHNLKSYN